MAVVSHVPSLGLKYPLGPRGVLGLWTRSQRGGAGLSRPLRTRQWWAYASKIVLYLPLRHYLVPDHTQHAVEALLCALGWARVGLGCQ